MDESSQNTSLEAQVFVDLIAHISSDGALTPLEIILESGERFKVDRVVERRYAPSLKCGGFGFRYTLMISGKSHFLWQNDAGAFYVQMKRDARIKEV